MKRKLWGGRFSKEMQRFVWDFCRGNCLDRKLAKEEIDATRAHVIQLRRLNILTKDEYEKIDSALESLYKEAQGLSSYEEEDIHSWLQEKLAQVIGEDLSRKIHTARSRNDLIVADEILATRKWIEMFLSLLARWQKELVNLAERYIDVVIPSYTHLQHAQVVRFSHYLLAYVEAIDRIKSFLRWQKESLSCPLGACAGVGTSLGIDVQDIAKTLGFSEVYANSMDAISNRDFWLDLLYALSRISLLVSRLCEDWILYSSWEFGWLILPEEFTTGSSIMPQKRNPDVLELIRGKSAKIISSLNALFILMKALPFTYNRDLQEDKEIVVPMVDEVKAILEILIQLSAGIEVRKDKAASLVDDDFLYATDLMECLISKGIDSRTSHRRVGELVRFCEESRCRMRDVEMAKVKEILGINIDEEEYKNVFDPYASVESKDSVMGTAKRSVLNRISFWKGKLKEEIEDV